MAPSHFTDSLLPFSSSFLSILLLPSSFFAGFQQGINKTKLGDDKEGFVDEATGEVTWRITVDADELEDNTPPPPYDSKAATGMVGITNQGATCYLNSLIQTLYHHTSLVKAVMELPGRDEGEEGKEGGGGGAGGGSTNIVFALQKLFLELQRSGEAVSTKALTKAFGWTSYEAFEQHDVQEMTRVLLDNLETKMKGTPLQGTIEDLFQGRVRSFVECINVR